MSEEQAYRIALGAAPKTEKPTKGKRVISRRHVVKQETEPTRIKLDHTSKKDDE